MEGTTLDSIVRRTLQTKKQTLHWYCEYMHYARTCVSSLSHTYRIVDNIKEAKVVPSGRLATIPGTATEVISVFGLLNDKRKKFHYNPKISYHADAIKGAATLPLLQSENTGTSLLATGIGMELVLPEFDNEMTYEWNYNEDRTSIVLGYLNDSTAIYVRYKTKGVTYSSATIVNTAAEDTIVAFIDLQIAKNNKERVGMIGLLEQEYKASRRKLKTRLSPYGMSELIEALRY